MRKINVIYKFNDNQDYSKFINSIIKINKNIYNLYIFGPVDSEIKIDYPIIETEELELIFKYNKNDFFIFLEGSVSIKKDLERLLFVIENYNNEIVIDKNTNRDLDNMHIFNLDFSVNNAVFFKGNFLQKSLLDDLKILIPFPILLNTALLTKFRNKEALITNYSSIENNINKKNEIRRDEFYEISNFVENFDTLNRSSFSWEICSWIIFSINTLLLNSINSLTDFEIESFLKYILKKYNKKLNNRLQIYEEIIKIGKINSYRRKMNNE